MTGQTSLLPVATARSERPLSTKALRQRDAGRRGLAQARAALAAARARQGADARRAPVAA